MGAMTLLAPLNPDFANNPTSKPNMRLLTPPKTAKPIEALTFKKPSLPKVSLLGGALKSLPFVATGLALADSLADSVNQAYTKKLLENPKWEPDNSFRTAYPQLASYADAVIANRKAENARLNLQQQKKEYDENVKKYIDYLGGADKISPDDMANLMRGTLENYPELMSAIGDTIPPYSTPSPTLPKNDSGVPFSPTPPSSPIPMGTKPKPASSTPSTAKTLLTVLEKNNEAMITAMTHHNNRIVLALRGEDDVPFPSDNTANPLTPDPLTPDTMPKVGVPYKDENGVYMVLGEDGITRMTTESQSHYNHVDYDKDVAKLMSARLSPRPQLGYEFEDTPFTSEYRKSVEEAQAKYDKEFGSPSELKHLMDRYQISDKDIDESFRKANIPLPVENVVPYVASDNSSSASSAPIVKNYINVDKTPVNVNIEKTASEQSLIALQTKALTFDTTPLKVDDMGDTIPTMTPQQMRAFKNAHAAKFHSDENSFEVQDDDIDDIFGSNMPDISAIFNHSSKIDRWTDVLTEFNTKP